LDYGNNYTSQDDRLSIFQRTNLFYFLLSIYSSLYVSFASIDIVVQIKRAPS